MRGTTDEEAILLRIRDYDDNTNRPRAHIRAFGDHCDPAIGLDRDGDACGDFEDNCPAVWNAAQTDTDGDGVGDECESCSNLTDPDPVCP